MQKLNSRKLWSFILSSGLILANESFGFGLSDKTIAFIATLAATYIAGQSYVDSKKPS